LKPVFVSVTSILPDRRSTCSSPLFPKYLADKKTAAVAARAMTAIATLFFI
jgi:hypothetical protein